MSDRGELRTIADAAILCAAFILVFMIAPAPSRFGSSLLGTIAFPHDAFLNEGVLEWGYRSIWSESRRLFDWPAGFPLANSLAGTENLLGWQLLYTPLRLAGVGIAASYNTLLLVSLVVSGAGTAALARRLGADQLSAYFAALAFAFNPFHLNHAVHLQTMAVCLAPFAILFLDKYLVTGRLRDALLMGALVLLTLLSGLYAGLMLGLAMLAYLLLSLRRSDVRPFTTLLPGFLVSALLGLALFLPVLLHYLAFAREHGMYRHPSQTLARFSLNLGGFARAPLWQSSLNHTPLSAKGFDALNAAFPGVMVTVLALLALIGRRERQDRDIRSKAKVLFWCSAVLTLFALGPFLKLRTDGIVEWARWLPMPGELWPLIPGIRWPMRVYLFAALFLALLAALGLTRITARMHHRQAMVTGVLSILLLVIELHPGRVYVDDSAGVVAPLELSDAYPYIALERDGGGVAELPSADNRGYATPLLTRYIYGSAGHLRRVVAYHGNNIPPVIDSLRIAIDSLPSASARELLRSHGVSRVIVHRQLMERKVADALVDSMRASGMPVLFDRGRSVVFALAASSGK